MNEIELHHLRCVLTLAEELNFGRAATRLYMSQPPLTRLVAEVEGIVGARLFERTTRRVSLTPIGEVFVAEARAILAHTDAAMETVRGAIRKQAGQLRLAYTPLAFQTVLPGIIAALRERDHDVNIDLTELLSSAQKVALAAGHIDMGFADEPVETKGYISVLLHEKRLGVVLPEYHALADRQCLTLVDLAEETIVLHTRSDYTRYYDRVIDACTASGFTPKIYHRIAGQNCIGLVATGQGLLLAPTLNQHPYPSGLCHIPLEATPTPICAEVWATIPVATDSPRMQMLCDLVRALALEVFAGSKEHR